MISARRGDGHAVDEDLYAIVGEAVDDRQRGDAPRLIDANAGRDGEQRGDVAGGCALASDRLAREYRAGRGHTHSLAADAVYVGSTVWLADGMAGAGVSAAGAGAVDCGGCVALSFGFFLIAGLAGGGACLSSAADFGADFAACGASFICCSTMIGGNLLASAGKA